MRLRILAALLCACTLGDVAVAETIVVNETVQVRETQVATPKRGITMSQVEQQFGAPVNRHAAVGQPPITRWDYSGFCVVFERDRVIDAVVTGASAPAGG